VPGYASVQPSCQCARRVARALLHAGANKKTRQTERGQTEEGRKVRPRDFLTPVDEDFEKLMQWLGSGFINAPDDAQSVDHEVEFLVLADVKTSGCERVECGKGPGERELASWEVEEFRRILLKGLAEAKKWLDEDLLCSHKREEQRQRKEAENAAERFCVAL